jgi:hypothetical protein
VLHLVETETPELEPGDHHSDELNASLWISHAMRWVLAAIQKTRSLCACTMPCTGASRKTCSACAESAFARAPASAPAPASASASACASAFAAGTVPGLSPALGQLETSTVAVPASIAYIATAAPGSLRIGPALDKTLVLTRNLLSSMRASHGV